MRPVDLTGQRFGRLVVGARAGSVNGRSVWRCACDCGSESVVAGTDLKRGHAKSCGCGMQRHGMYKAPEYSVWAAMLQRCRNPRAQNYSLYGARGISVCERWSDFANFIADMGQRPLGGTLDRINNDGNYEPMNCQWVTMAEQTRNTRRVKSLTLNGRTMLLTDWAAELGLTTGALCTRVKRWGVERALSTPVYAYMRRP